MGGGGVPVGGWGGVMGGVGGGGGGWTRAGTGNGGQHYIRPLSTVWVWHSGCRALNAIHTSFNYKASSGPAHLVGVLMTQGAAGIGGRSEIEVVEPHVGCELEAALGRQALVVPAKDQVAQASAS